MSKLRDSGKYRPGDSVQIASAKALTESARVWNHTLHPGQLSFAGQAAKVADSFVNRGSDVFYELEGVPGIWHQGLLLPL